MIPFGLFFFFLLSSLLGSGLAGSVILDLFLERLGGSCRTKAENLQVAAPEGKRSNSTMTAEKLATLTSVFLGIPLPRRGALALRLRPAICPGPKTFENQDQAACHSSNSGIMSLRSIPLATLRIDFYHLWRAVIAYNIIPPSDKLCGQSLHVGLGTDPDSCLHFAQY